MSVRPLPMAPTMDRSTARRPWAYARCAAGVAMLLSTTALASGALAQAPAAAAPPSTVQAPPPATDQAQPAAPTPPPPPTSGVVQRIVIQGNERIEKRDHSRLSADAGRRHGGRRADRRRHQGAVPHRTLRRRRGFALQPAAILVVRVVKNPIINRVVFEVNSNIFKDDKLQRRGDGAPAGHLHQGQGRVRRPAHRRALPPLRPHRRHRHAAKSSPCLKSVST